MGKLNKFIVDKNGQWAHPGKPTAVPTKDGRITMEGVPYPVMGFVPGQPPIMMQPGGKYQFPGKMVYEIPMAQSGGDISIPDLSDKGWLSKYQKGGKAFRRSVSKDYTKEVQSTLNKNYGTKLAVDGVWGPLTEAAYQQYWEDATTKKNEANKFKSVKNTDDLRYVGVAPEVQESTRVNIPNIENAPKTAKAVKKEADRLKTEMKKRGVETPQEVYNQEAQDKTIIDVINSQKSTLKPVDETQDYSLWDVARYPMTAIRTYNDYGYIPKGFNKIIENNGMNPLDVPLSMINPTAYANAIGNIAGALTTSETYTETLPKTLGATLGFLMNEDVPEEWNDEAFKTIGLIADATLVSQGLKAVSNTSRGLRNMKSSNSITTKTGETFEDSKDFLNWYQKTQNNRPLLKKEINFLNKELQQRGILETQRSHPLNPLPKLVRRGLVPEDYNVEKVIRESIPNIVDSYTKGMGSVYSKYEMGPGRLNAFNQWLGLPTKGTMYRVHPQSFQNGKGLLYTTSDDAMRGVFSKDLRSQVPASENLIPLSKDTFNELDIAYRMGNKQPYYKDLRALNYPAVKNKAQFIDELGIQPTSNPNVIIDWDKYTGTGGGVNWLRIPKKGGGYEWVMRDTWDIQPFSRQTNLPKFIRDIDVANIIGAKNFDVNWNYVTSPKFNKITNPYYSGSSFRIKKEGGWLEKYQDGGVKSFGDIFEYIDEPEGIRVRKKGTEDWKQLDSNKSQALKDFMAKSDAKFAAKFAPKVSEPQGFVDNWLSSLGVSETKKPAAPKPVAPKPLAKNPAEEPANLVENPAMAEIAPELYSLMSGVDIPKTKEIEKRREVNKYAASPEFFVAPYKDEDEAVNAYKQTADFNLRHKNASDYTPDDIIKVQSYLDGKGYYPETKKIIKVEDYQTPEQVIELQKYLANEGLLEVLGVTGENIDGNLSGKIDKQTLNAIRQYNMYNQKYNSGQLDNNTKDAIRAYKNKIDAKSTLGIPVRSPFELYDPQTGEPDVGLTNQSMQDFEKDLMKRGFFTGNVKYDFNLKPSDIKIGYNFSIDPNQDYNKTEDAKVKGQVVRGCAQYINGTVCSEDVVGEEAREELGFRGDAWTLSENLQNKGGKLLFTGLPERSQIPLSPKAGENEIKNYLKSTLNNDAVKGQLREMLNTGNIRPGDVVNIFYEGSPSTKKAWNQTQPLNNRFFTTHVGIVKADKDGKLYVEHNVHGDLQKQPVEDFIEGKVPGNSKSQVSLIAGITRPNYFDGVDNDGRIPAGGISYYQTEYGQFKPEGALANQADWAGQSISGENTHKFLSVIEKNKDSILKDIPITENEFGKLMRVARIIPTRETYAGKNYEKSVMSNVMPYTSIAAGIVAKELQDALMPEREKSMGISSLKDETNINPQLRSKLYESDYELTDPVKAGIPTFYVLSKNYLYLKEVANEYGLDMTSDQLAKLAGISYNQSIGKVAAQLIEQGGYDNYINYRRANASKGDGKFQYHEAVDLYDKQTMQYGGWLKKYQDGSQVGPRIENLPPTPNMPVDKAMVEDKLSIVNQLDAIQKNSQTMGFDPIQAAELMSIADKLVKKAKTKYPDDNELLAVLDKRINMLGQQLITSSPPISKIPLPIPKIFKGAQDYHEAVNYDESKEEQIQDEYYKRLNTILTKEKNRFKLNPGTINPSLIKFMQKGGSLQKYQGGGSNQDYYDIQSEMNNVRKNYETEYADIQRLKQNLLDSGQSHFMDNAPFCTVLPNGQQYCATRATEALRKSGYPVKQISSGRKLKEELTPDKGWYPTKYENLEAGDVAMIERPGYWHTMVSSGNVSNVDPRIRRNAIDTQKGFFYDSGSGKDWTFEIPKNEEELANWMNPKTMNYYSYQGKLPGLESQYADYLNKLNAVPFPYIQSKPAPQLYIPQPVLQNNQKQEFEKGGSLSKNKYINSVTLSNTSSWLNKYK